MSFKELKRGDNNEKSFLIMVFMIVISILNAFERVPIYSSQYLEYDGNGITLPNGDFCFLLMPLLITV